jgi:hypothetical protein
MMKVWLDDIRIPPDGWIWAKNADEFSVLLFTRYISEISFDHDIASFTDTGDEVTGYTCLCWVEKMIMNDPNFPIPKMYVHSANPVGRQKMQKVIDKIERVI